MSLHSSVHASGRRRVQPRLGEGGEDPRRERVLRIMDRMSIGDEIKDYLDKPREVAGERSFGYLGDSAALLLRSE